MRSWTMGDIGERVMTISKEFRYEPHLYCLNISINVEMKCWAL